MNQTAYLEIEQYRPRPVLFSLSGRIGRARYVVYGIGAICCAFLLMILAGYAAHLTGAFGRMMYQLVFYTLYFFALPVFFMQLTVRRAHDFNAEGWIAVLLLVPVVNLLFWAVPGTRGENQYGSELEPESLGMKIASTLLPLLLLAAFLSADTQMPDQDTDQSAAKPATSLKAYTP